MIGENQLRFILISLTQDKNAIIATINSRVIIK